MTSPVEDLGSVVTSNDISLTPSCQAPAWGHVLPGQGGITTGTTNTISNMSISTDVDCPSSVSANTGTQSGAFGSTGVTSGITDKTDPGSGRLTSAGDKHVCYN